MDFRDIRHMDAPIFWMGYQSSTIRFHLVTQRGQRIGNESWCSFGPCLHTSDAFGDRREMTNHWQILGEPMHLGPMKLGMCSLASPVADVHENYYLMVSIMMPVPSYFRVLSGKL